MAVVSFCHRLLSSLAIVPEGLMKRGRPPSRANPANPRGATSCCVALGCRVVFEKREKHTHANSRRPIGTYKSGRGTLQRRIKPFLAQHLPQYHSATANLFPPFSRALLLFSLRTHTACMYISSPSAPLLFPPPLHTVPELPFDVATPSQTSPATLPYPLPFVPAHSSLAQCLPLNSLPA